MNERLMNINSNENNNSNISNNDNNINMWNNLLVIIMCVKTVLIMKMKVMAIVILMTNCIEIL